MKKILSSLFFIFAINCFAKSPSPEIYSVVDLSSGNYLEQSNINKIHSIASLTKLMTAYVLIKYHPNLEACASKVTEDDKDYLKGTKTRMEMNAYISCKKLLQAMLVMSDNWAASALSKTIPGVSSRQFIQLMNAQAKEWGMTSTFFRDSSGLSPENQSTAHNMNTLIYQVSSVKLINDLSSQKDILFVKNNGEMRFFKNTNKLIRESNYQALLSKTGYIKESGYNLIFVPKNCQKQNIALLIMGAKSSATRARFAEKILGKYSCV